MRSSNPLGIIQSNPRHGGVLAGLTCLDVQWQWHHTDLTVSLTGTCVPQGSVGSHRKYESHCQEGGSVRLYVRLRVRREQKERASAPPQRAKLSAALLPETKGICEEGWSAGREMIYPRLQIRGTKSCLLLNFPKATLRPKDSTFLPVKEVWRVSRLYFKTDLGTLYHRHPFLPISRLADMPLVSCSLSSIWVYLCSLPSMCAHSSA